MSYQIRMTQGQLPADFISQLSPEEGQGVNEVSSRPDTVSMLVTGDGNAAVGYAVFGRDEGDMIAVYYARAFVPMFGPMMMKKFFGVAQIMGQPLRMHAQSLRDIQIKARIFGADFATDAVDSDGILQGVFS